jgi:hypothetical protein
MEVNFTYPKVCHTLRNLVVVAAGMVRERTRLHRDLRVALAKRQPTGVLHKQLLDFLCRVDELDARILAKMQECESVLGEAHGDAECETERGSECPRPAL